jgi:hypothetical protein
VIALRKIKSGLEAVTSNINYPIDSVQLEMIKALGEIGDSDSAARLEVKVSTRNPAAISKEAREAIGRIRQRISATPRKGQ